MQELPPKPLSEYKISTKLASNTGPWQWIGVFPERSAEYDLQLRVWCIPPNSKHAYGFTYPELVTKHPYLLRSLKECMTAIRDLTKWREPLRYPHVPCGFRLQADEGGRMIALSGTYNANADIGGLFSGKEVISYVSCYMQNTVRILALLAQFMDFELKMIEFIEDRIRFKKVNFDALARGDVVLTLPEGAAHELAKFEACVRLETYSVRTSEHTALKTVVAQFKTIIQSRQVTKKGVVHEPTKAKVSGKRKHTESEVGVARSLASMQRNVTCAKYVHEQKRGVGRPMRQKAHELDDEPAAAIPSRASIVAVEEAAEAVTIQQGHVDALLGTMITTVRHPAIP